jgi:hypothetical protein
MTDEQILSLSRTQAWAAGGLTWCKWITAQPGQYATETEAQAAADAQNAARKRDLFWYSATKNRNSGWDVTAASCDG